MLTNYSYTTQEYGKGMGFLGNPLTKFISTIFPNENMVVLLWVKNVRHCTNIKINLKY